MPKKKSANILTGANQKQFFMNRTAKRMARRLKLTGEHVQMVTISGTRRGITPSGKRFKVSAWEQTKKKSFWDKFAGWWDDMTKGEKDESVQVSQTE